MTSVEAETNIDQTQQTLVSIQNGGDGELYFIGRGGTTDPNNSPDDDWPSVIARLSPTARLVNHARRR